MITTKNLILTPVSYCDLDIYSQILGSDELTKFLPKGRAYSDEEIQSHLTNRVKHWEHGFGSYVISLKNELKTKIGYVGVEFCENSEFSDIRYALVPCHQGQGYVFEAAYTVLEQTFRVGKHSKIYGVALKENLPSLTIIRKLGMTAEPTVNLYGDVDNLETYAIEKFI
ncbi:MULTISPECIES: GNAT family N-acetyltransferase [Vibrio]|uniref:GNAT family N-acetyltransferase n=1 Tax=Vibrio lentus TaxID=136468 RepID=A0A1B9QAL9_9VIBR|nr:MULTISPECIES: GNAT family N-acetyltransferase [Vibrio]EDK26205.1 Acetyltransferase, including N-acetylases of ribosomal protein [Vibrionales bacterium SWAT-3]OCH57069.1 acetyltransferase [Vibrio lentus]PME52432.1 GNAT family N-acetyltransferase [Vibrio lentus]PME58809.1 GNAT family N-acetyltransferase [Vibrio lentus]PME85289.1 GNAT family N-acetyltransferase [Vibrio lentus]